MEVHARYSLMGMFTLAVIAVGFLFVYWLQSGGGLAERVGYRVRFDGPVAGLAKGSAVLFNGVRVGEVTSLSLDEARPGGVNVEMAVERKAPVRADTIVDIEFQGLAGAPALSLTGGTPGASLLSSGPAEGRQLTAVKDAGQSMTQAARDVLRKLDAVVTDNAKAFTSAISNIDTFTAALSRNSDKVDGIVAGLERLTGGGTKQNPRIFEIGAATAFPAIKAFPQGQMQVTEPTMLANLESEKITVTGGPQPRLDNAQWSDLLPRVVQSALLRSFENAGYRRVFARVPDGAKTDFQLLTDVRRFQIVVGPQIKAEVELAVRIMKADGTVSDTKVFRADAPASSLEPDVATKSLDEAFRKVASEVVVWTSGAL